MVSWCLDNEGQMFDNLLKILAGESFYGGGEGEKNTVRPFAYWEIYIDSEIDRINTAEFPHVDYAYLLSWREETVRLLVPRSLIERNYDELEGRIPKEDRDRMSAFSAIELFLREYLGKIIDSQFLKKKDGKIIIDFFGKIYDSPGKYILPEYDYIFTFINHVAAVLKQGGWPPRSAGGGFVVNLLLHLAKATAFSEEMHKYLVLLDCINQEEGKRVSLGSSEKAVGEQDEKRSISGASCRYCGAYFSPVLQSCPRCGASR